jgi:hypothetical protein
MPTYVEQMVLDRVLRRLSQDHGSPHEPEEPKAPEKPEAPKPPVTEQPAAPAQPGDAPPKS